MYTRIKDLKSCVVPADRLSEEFKIEPARVFSDIPPALFTISDELSVEITDGSITTEMKFEVFLRKPYSVKNGKVRIGSLLFELHGLKIFLKLGITIYDFESMTEQGLD